MDTPLTKIFRSRALKKYACGISTGMIPLSSIHEVFILLDSRDENAGDCVSLVNEFFRSRGIRPDIFYIDTGGRRNKEKAMLTDPLYTFQKKDLNWYGRPRKKILRPFLEARQDLYIDLTSRCDFTVRFLDTAVPARFKVGCSQQCKDIFDLTVTPQDSSAVSSPELFRGISAMLLTVK